MINIITICTGKYSVFFDNFYTTFEKYFLPNHKKTYFVFTDQNILKTDNVVNIQQKKLGWPYDTMMRFHMFKKLELNSNDYMFFLNANMIANEIIEDDILPTNQNNYLMGVQHPGFYNIPPNMLPYERREKSKLKISFNNGKYYYQGCFNGGRVKEFLSMSRELSELIDIDLTNSIIPIWHDESALNYYYHSIDPLILNPGYAYPETWNIPFSKKIIQLDKSKFGGHDYLRSHT